MRNIHFVATALAVAVLSACGGGSNGPTSPIPSNGSGSKTLTQSITAHTYTLNPVPAGSGPSIQLTDYSDSQYASDGNGLAVTKDGSVWWESYVSAPIGSAMKRRRRRTASTC